MPVRLARPTGVAGVDDLLTNPIYATAIGLLLYSADNELVQSVDTHSVDDMSLTADERSEHRVEKRESRDTEQGSWVSRIKTWVQGNF